jgi:type IV secretion system protein VirB6
MAADPIQLTSLGGIARWMDASITHMLKGVVAPAVSHATAAIWPFVTIAMTIGLMWYGWMIASGAIPTPIFTALRRVVNIVIIAGVAGAGGLYQTEIVDIMLELPTEMTNVFNVEPSTPAQRLDEAANNGSEISTVIQDRAPNSVTSPIKAFAFVVIAVIITVISAVLSAVGIIVLVSIKAGMGIVAIIGPLFIAALLFDFTKKYFEQWLGQVFYYGIYAALFTVVFTIIMGMFGMLQHALLATAKAEGDINIFSMLTAMVLFMVGAKFMLEQVSAIATSITRGQGGGISVPFVGKLG